MTAGCEVCSVDLAPGHPGEVCWRCESAFPQLVAQAA